jgi:hypothetical protein
MQNKHLRSLDKSGRREQSQPSYMTNLQNLTVAQLRKVVGIKEEIEQLEAQLAAITDAEAPAAAEASPQRRRRKMSAAARAAIGAAQRRRWAKVKGRRGPGRPPKAAKIKNVVKKKRKVSAATKAKLAIAAKARWARAKAAGKSEL